MRGKKYLDKEEGERGKEVKGADKMERKTKKRFGKSIKFYQY